MKLNDKKPKGVSNKDKNPTYMDDETFLVASTTECTGLIPSKPESQDEIDSYNEIYHIYPEDDLT